MSSQIQITGETKVKSLTGVLVGTSGVVSFLPIDVSLGIPQLDVNGKILVSQLPNSVMEYKGTWDASTNTPTLANGTGNQGDVYLCNVAGTVNFGAGAIAFFVGDQVIYSGSIWQRASGATGTVTSVAITESGDSLNITGSPITTSGTINIGFNGTNLQYVNGAGNLTTFPILTGYVTAVSGTAPVVSSGGTTPAISMAAATGSVDGYLSATDFAIFNAKQSALTFSSPLVNTSGTISIPAATTSVNGYLASADFTTFNNKQNAITLTTTGTSGASTLVGATLNIPNYGSALTGYVPYTGATQDVDLGAFSLNGKSLHIKGTAGNGHLGLKHQSAAATGSANESLIYADSLGDLSWQNANLYLSKFITSANTANRSYTFPNATCNIPDDSLVVHLAGTETITGAKTFSGYTTFTSTVDITSGLTFSNSGFTLLLQPPTLSVNRTVTLPNATGTLALTSDISYPVSSVFGRTGAVVATSGDYTTTQVTEGTNLYYTDVRARAALSFVAGSGAYNSTTGVITIPTNNNQITNGAGYTTNVGTVTSVAATGGTGISITGSPITTSGTITITNTAPDQVVALTASTGISVTGTYPSFTIASTITQYTDALARLAISLTTTGTSGAATYNNTTGVLNIPQYIGGVTSVFGRTGAVVAAEGDYSLTQLSDVTITSPTTNQVLKYNGTAWINDTDANTGTVTSVGLSAPTGFSVTGSPVTSSGTLALAFASGYSLPTTVKQSNWDDAYTFVAAFPTQTGNSGKYLTTDGSVLSWATNPLGTVTSVGLSSATSGVTIGSSPITTSGTITLAIATATTSQNGLLSSSDFTTFNNKANALSGTINTIAYWDSATTINSLALATYPSLTEISYVKGVTSAIQTQLNAKQGTLTLTTTGTSGAATFSANTLNIPDYGSALSGYLPLTGGTLTGNLSLTSAATGGVIITNNNNSHINLFRSISPTANFGININGNGDLNIDETGVATRLTITKTTGAATFSSRVNVNGALDNVLYALNIIGDAAFDGTRATPAYVYARRNGDDSKLILKAGSTATYFSQIDVSGWNGTGTPAYISLNAGSGTGIYINNGNNVLIGTATDNGNAKVQINGALQVQGFFNSTSASTGGIDYSGGGTRFFSVGTSGSTKGLFTFIAKGADDSSITPLTIASTGAATFSSGIATLGYTASTSYAALFNGSVGIGTSSPQVKLHVLNSAVGGTYYGQLTVEQSGECAIQIKGGSYSSIYFSDAANPYEAGIVFDHTTNNLELRGSGNTVDLNIASTGNVLIGTTTDASGKLQVLGSNSAIIAQFKSSSGMLQLYPYYSTYDGPILQALDGAGTNYKNMRIEAASATFNCSVTAAALTISGSTNAIATINSTYVGGGFLQMQASGTVYGYVGCSASILSGTTNDFVVVSRIGTLELGANSARGLIFSTSNVATFTSSVYATGFFESSDSRLKTLIQDNYQTKGIASITPKLYTKNGKVELGYYAQDFVGILDSAVSKGSDDMLSLSYREVHTAKIYALEQEIKELKAKFN